MENLLEKIHRENVLNSVWGRHLSLCSCHQIYPYSFVYIAYLMRSRIIFIRRAFVISNGSSISIQLVRRASLIEFVRNQRSDMRFLELITLSNVRFENLMELRPNKHHMSQLINKLQESLYTSVCILPYVRLWSLPLSLSLSLFSSISLSLSFWASVSFEGVSINSFQSYF